MSRRPQALLTVLAGLAAASSPAATAHADEPIATTDQPLQMTADAGAVAWLTRADGGYRIVAAVKGAAPQRVGPVLHGQPTIDVAASRTGGAVVVWAQGCSAQTRHCDVKSLALGGTGRATAKTIAQIPFGGGATPAVSAAPGRLAYTVATFRGSGKTRVRCDVPYITSSAGLKRLNRGACAIMPQLDLEGGKLAVLALPAAVAGEEPGRVSEARLLGTTGATSERLQRESQGEESNFIDEVALDGGRVYTDRGGFRQANVFSRFDANGKRTDARAFTNLSGGFARDGGHNYYVANSTDGEDGECTGDAGTDCDVVSGSDPFASASRTLPAVLTLKEASPILYADAPLELTGTLLRPRATRAKLLDPAPVTGATVDLSGGTLDKDGQTDFAPNGMQATTGADGSWTVSIPSPHPPRGGFLATTGTLGKPGRAGTTAVYPTVFARMAVTSSSRTDGNVIISGTISPAQPGRKVKLDQRTKRSCSTAVGDPSYVSPSTVDTPKGCVDLFTTVGTTTVSADGASFTITKPAAAGSYRVSLNFAGADPLVSGETAQVPVG